MKEREISVTKRGYKRFLHAAQRKELNTAKIKMEFYFTYELFKDTLVVFQSSQNWWCCVFVLRNWKRNIFHRGLSWNFQPILGNGLIPGGKEKDKAPHAVFRTPTNPFWKWPGGRRTSWWLHSSTGSTLRNSLETRPECCILGTIIKSAGSRIGILADEVICNHDLRNDTWRLHWSCDLSGRRSSNFRKAWNSKAGS